MQQVLETCRVVSDSEAQLVWVDDDFLQAQEVAPYSELPLWVPSDYISFGTFDCRRAIAAGLRFRSLQKTVRRTLEWLATRPSDWEWRAGLTPEREAELLALWQAQAGDG